MVLNCIKAVFILMVLGLVQCSAPNKAINKLFNEHQELLSQKKKLEKRYFITLGHLQKFPKERTLRLQQAEIKKSIVEINVKLAENRQQLDLAIKEWEKMVSDTRTEQQYIEGQERRLGPRGVERPGTRNY